MFTNKESRKILSSFHVHSSSPTSRETDLNLACKSPSLQHFLTLLRSSSCCCYLIRGNPTTAGSSTLRLLGFLSRWMASHSSSCWRDFRSFSWRISLVIWKSTSESKGIVRLFWMRICFFFFLLFLIDVANTSQLVCVWVMPPKGWSLAVLKWNIYYFNHGNRSFFFFFAATNL